MKDSAHVSLSIGVDVSCPGGSLRVQIDFRPKFFECKEEAPASPSGFLPHALGPLGSSARSVLSCCRQRKRMRHSACRNRGLRPRMFLHGSECGSCTASLPEQRRPECQLYFVRAWLAWLRRMRNGRRSSGRLYDETCLKCRQHVATSERRPWQRRSRTQRG